MLEILIALLISYPLVRIYVWYIEWKWMRYLPVDGDLFMHVRTDEPVTVRKTHIFCGHATKTEYVIIDSTEGSGLMSDTYEGKACVNCGRVISIRKTY